MREQTKSRIKLLALAVIFFGPFIAAALFYFGPKDWIPETRTAHGRLITPARPLPALGFSNAAGEPQVLQGRWTLLHLGGAACAEVCRQQLWETRQLRTLLHRRRDRVQRAYLASDAAQAQVLAGELAEEHPRLGVLSLPRGERQRFMVWLGEMPETAPILLIDPLGNLLMVYGEPLPRKGMLGDIKRLLKLSSIG